MSTKAEPNAQNDGVHRLVDMVVEEVSLVDRAANKHRFLVVKRDTPMKNPPDTKQPNAEEDDENTADADAAPSKPKKPRRAGAKKADNADAIAAATGLLERLTTAVEMLGEASDDDAEELLIELASELSEAAAEIAEAAGVAEDGEEGETAKRAAMTETVAKVRALLAEVTSMLATAKTAPATEATRHEPPAPTPPPEARVSEHFEAVATSLRTLTNAVKEQGQRLGRLEKNTALPNSRAHDERTRVREEADVGWPLDLNRPLDRESVDKAVSFHDR